MTNHFAAISALRAHLNAKFLERNDIVDGLLIALLAKQSIFLLGMPGVAKSAISEEICKAIQGNYFSWLLTKFSKPEEIFGPLDLPAFEKGEYRHLTTNKLPEAKICFLDEIFKSSSAIINTMLTIINERKFFNGTCEQACPLETIVCASNEVPESGELAAFFDRLVLKYEARNLQDDSSVEALLMAALAPSVPAPQISAQDLADAQAIVSSMPVPAAAIKAFVEIRRAIVSEGIYISERKLKQALACCQAAAYLNGHAQVELEDLEILRHIFWQRLEQQKAVSKIIFRIANPIGEVLNTIRDGIEEVCELLNNKKLSAYEAQSKIGDAIHKLEKISSENKSEKANEFLKFAREKNMWICREHLKLRI